ncbi:MAG: 4Fe-4S dicluster domain-containing protein [Dehalococcoidia bacterium]
MRSSTEKIASVPELCSGCLMCQLACSFAWARAYNPSKSRILVEEMDDTNPFSIVFTEECNDCGLCVRYCVYGALLLRKDT